MSVFWIRQLNVFYTMIISRNKRAWIVEIQFLPSAFQLLGRGAWYVLEQRSLPFYTDVLGPFWNDYLLPAQLGKNVPHTCSVQDIRV